MVVENSWDNYDINGDVRRVAIPEIGGGKPGGPEAKWLEYLST